MDDWTALLEPFGYVDITVHAPACLHGSPHLLNLQFNIILKEPAGDAELDEWERRIKMLHRAQLAVKAVQEEGYDLEDPPRIEFGGNYYHRFGHRNTDWNAEVRLMFEVYTKN
jgi:hypothetical protein